MAEEEAAARAGEAFAEATAGMGGVGDEAAGEGTSFESVFESVKTSLPGLGESAGTTYSKHVRCMCTIECRDSVTLPLTLNPVPRPKHCRPFVCLPPFVFLRVSCVHR